MIIRLALCFVLAGCASSQFVVGPVLAPSIRSIPSFERFSARVNGPFLELEVHTQQREDQYRGNFDLEVETAAEICGRLSRNQDAFGLHWDILVLSLFTQYGPFRWHTTTGWLQVRVPRETLRAVGGAGTPALECRTNWERGYGWKAGPESERLEWKPEDPDPIPLGKSR